MVSYAVRCGELPAGFSRYGRGELGYGRGLRAANAVGERAPYTPNPSLFERQGSVRSGDYVAPGVPLLIDRRVAVRSGCWTANRSWSRESTFVKSASSERKPSGPVKISKNSSLRLPT